MKYQALGVAVVLAAGCVEVEDPELGTTDSNIESQNRLAANRLAANSLQTSRLATARLTPSTADLVTMTADAGGRELLTYVISCALPATASLTVNGTIYYGDIGLAPAWLDRSLTLDERRWVSGCLLARTNLFGVTVQLSMRGADGVLGVTKVEKAGFNLFEGVFWGDVFAGSANVMKACRSQYKATNPQISTLPQRECTVPDPLNPGKTRCGFTYVGICETVCADAKAGYRYAKCDGQSPVISVVLAQP